MAAEHEALFALHPQGGVGTGDEALACSLFVAGSAVDLACEPQAFGAAHAQRVVELERLHKVVLHRVAVAQEAAFLEPRDGAQHLFLHLAGQRS